MDSKIMDRELIEGIQNGCHKSFQKLEYKYKKLVFSIILRILRDEEETKDVSQEVWVKAYLQIKAGNYRHESKFSNYISTLAKNKAIDYTRKVRPQMVDVEESFAAVPEPNAEEMIIEKERDNFLLSQVQKLRPEFQEIVYLRCYRGWKFKEISEHNNTNINTNIARMRYALEKLREAYSV